MNSSNAPRQAGLGRFRTAKQEEIDALRAIRAAGPLPVWEGPRPSFIEALRRRPVPGPLAVIAEYKRASPSRGRICDSVSVTDAALAYAANGASCLSILTEERYFDGSLDFLRQAREALGAGGFATPLLRKDFLFDPVQVEATFATPASAFLLIVRQSPDAAALRAMRELGESRGLDAVVEIFDGDDLELARESGARIIQVNARDLETFRVDRQACLDLIRAAGRAEGEVWIAASGMERAEHLAEAAAAGYDAALVGTALMSRGRPGEDLAALLAGDGHVL